MNKLAAAGLSLLILTISHVVVFRSTQLYYENEAISRGYGFYNVYDDFAWRSKHDVGIIEIKEQLAKYREEKQLEDKKFNNTPLDKSGKLNKDKVW